MTAQNQETIDTEHEDELVVHSLLSQMIQEERWELTSWGRQHLKLGNGNHHQHRLGI